MKCYSPIQVKGTKGKNQGRYFTAPCGRCPSCVSNRRMEWATRLEFELKKAESAHFITLTYDEENLPVNKSLDKEHLQLWIKRLRKSEEPNKIKYYSCGEYGGKFNRPHYHLIIFNLLQSAEKLSEQITKTWKKGSIHIGEVNPASIKYITGYMVQQQQNSSQENSLNILRPFSTMSQGLGKDYIKSRKAWHHELVLRNYVVKEGGVKSRLPRYYRDKIYTKKQKEKQKQYYLDEMTDNFDEKKESILLNKEVDQKENFKRKFNKTVK